MIKFNWRFSDFSNFGEMSRKLKFKTLIFRSFQQSEFCVVNRLFCLSETQYLHAEIE